MNIIISNSTETPIYEQIKEQIKELIVRGELKPGEALPSMRSFAKDLKVSVITTKRAYNDLEQEGYIYTVQGKGSFINHLNTELINEENLQRIEEKLQEVIELARMANLKKKDIIEILEILMEEN